MLSYFNVVGSDAMLKAERYRGCLLGLAVGDALGTAIEFRPPGSFTPIQDMIGGGPFNLSPGQWTDDTSMALCLAESLVEKQGFDPGDQMDRYVNWWRKGYLSSTGRCFDIGTTTREALSRFLRTNNPFSGSTQANSAGNGSVMRLAPVPMFFAEDPLKAIEMAADSSRTTHGAPAAVDGCRYFAALMVGALRGASKQELLSDLYCPARGCWDVHPLVPEIHAIASGSYRTKEPPAIQGTGYVVKSLEAALWAFHKTDNFRDGCLLAANLGDDADTTAAVYGQLAGAFYGEPGIPKPWLDKLAMREIIASLANRLLSGAYHGNPIPPIPLSQRFGNAFAYAFEVHRNQGRKQTSIPYIAHLMAVAALVLEDGGLEDDAIAALLHDAAEDHGGRGRLEDIRAKFGDRVAEIVDGCTDTYDDPKPDWRPRKEAYIRRLRRESDYVVRVSLADKLHNARCILRDFKSEGDKLWTRFNAGPDDQLWYYKALRDVFLERHAGSMAFEFASVIDELEKMV